MLYYIVLYGLILYYSRITYIILSHIIVTVQATAPGRTCIVGAGYVALECAGFINGLHQVTTYILRQQNKMIVFLVWGLVLKHDHFILLP